MNISAFFSFLLTESGRHERPKQALGSKPVYINTCVHGNKVY